MKKRNNPLTDPPPSCHTDSMKNQELSTLSPLELAEKALEWWCPDRDGNDPQAVASGLAAALEAATQGDFSQYHTELNHLAASELGYDTEDEEEALLGYLDDLCQGYHD